jgi:hypothetical protein
MNTDQVVNRNPIDSVAVNETITRSTRLRDDVQGQARTIANRAMEENRALTDAEVRELTVLREDATRYESAITEANKTISDARSHRYARSRKHGRTIGAHLSPGTEERGSEAFRLV